MDEDLDHEQMPRFVLCRVCRCEVPLSEAVVPEAVDYMAYFCGLDCYASWRARAADVYALGR